MLRRESVPTPTRAQFASVMVMPWENEPASPASGEGYSFSLFGVLCHAPFRPLPSLPSDLCRTSAQGGGEIFTSTPIKLISQQVRRLPSLLARVTKSIRVLMYTCLRS